VDMTFFYAIDPHGVEHILPISVGNIGQTLLFPLMSTTYMIILFHWAEIYYKTVKVLQQEEMLQKVNSRYKSKITVKDILSKVKILNKLRWPFVVVNTFGFLFAIAELAVIGKPVQQYVGASFVAYFFFMYLLESIGFIVYGRKLVVFLPGHFKKKILKITNTIMGLAAFFMCLLLIYILIAYLDDGAKLFLVRHTLQNVCAWVNLALMISLFIPKREICCCCSSFDDSNSSNSNSNKSSLMDTVDYNGNTTSQLSKVSLSDPELIVNPATSTVTTDELLDSLASLD